MATAAPFTHPARSLLLGPALIVSILTLLRLAVELVTQLVVATVLGAGPEMDAYLAAITLPQYVVAVLSGALSVVLIPLVVGLHREGRESDGWELVSATLNVCLLALAGVAALGVMGAEVILAWTAPGLVAETSKRAAEVAVIAWPAIVANGAIVVLTSVYQAQTRFGWPAAVPIVGSLCTLGLVPMLGSWLGGVGLALATIAGLLVQVTLLAPVLIEGGAYRLTLGRDSAALGRLWRLFWPLLLSGFFIRATTVVDLYAASALPEGTISHLGYAFRIVAPLAILIATGVATVLLPRMALEVAGGELQELRRTFSLGLRMVWLVAAPACVLLTTLAVPLVVVLYQRGAFTLDDARAVSVLLQWYAPAVMLASLGGVTGRAFYALRATRLVAIMGVAEMLAYALYTPWLAMRLAGAGIALSYVIYFAGSLLWHVPLIYYRLGGRGGLPALIAFVRITLAALVGGGVAWIVAGLWAEPWLQVLLAAPAGVATYLVALYWLRSEELRMLGQAMWALAFPAGPRSS